MKCDRRWYNDGRHERECATWSDRDTAPDDVVERWRARYGSDWEVDVRCADNGGYHVMVWPRGAVFHVALPKDSP